MTDTKKPISLNFNSVDREALAYIFETAIKEEAIRIFRESVGLNDVKTIIAEAFRKKWLSDKDTWLESSVKDAMHTCLYRSVAEAVDKSGVKGLIEQVVTEHIATPEFQESLKRRTLETMYETTFYVKPKPQETEDD